MPVESVLVAELMAVTGALVQVPLASACYNLTILAARSDFVETLDLRSELTMTGV